MSAACFLLAAALGALSGLSLWQRWPSFDGGFWLAFWLFVLAVAAMLGCLTVRLWRAGRWGRSAATLLAVTTWVWIGLPAGVAAWLAVLGVSIEGLAAPERADHPGGRTLRLSYLRHPHRVSRRRPGRKRGAGLSVDRAASDLRAHA